MEKNYYDILRVPHDASVEDIKRAYRILAKQFHPDAPYGSEEKFKELSEAYRILYYEDTRKEHDASLKTEAPVFHDEHAKYSSEPKTPSSQTRQTKKEEIKISQGIDWAFILRAIFYWSLLMLMSALFGWLFKPWILEPDSNNVPLSNYSENSLLDSFAIKGKDFTTFHSSNFIEENGDKSK